MCKDSCFDILWIMINNNVMARNLFLVIFGLLSLVASAQTISLGRGQLRMIPVAKNAIRIQYTEEGEGIKGLSNLPDWLYVKHDKVGEPDFQVNVDQAHHRVTIADRKGKTVFTATRHELRDGVATLAFRTTADEYQYGLGQFQDGFANVKGLSRRLTQVNTQVSIPLLLSNKGYGILWNNYGMTEFNPANQSITLKRQEGTGVKEVVNVTSTEGGKRELRESNVFEGTLNIPETGYYSLLLDVGQRMARRHNLVIDGKQIINVQNTWLPPTTSTIVRLRKGHHTVTSELTKDDRPVIYYKKVSNETVFRSPVAQSVDYTVFVGTPDEVIASYRELTGKAPLMPIWALGYIHCRERFHSSNEIIETANRFRREQLPLDMIVQDWLYWGKYGWNAMQFDERYYPSPRALTDSLHQMHLRMMLSVWSKIDRNSELGQQMAQEGYYISNTDWVDFFNPKAANFYWQNFSQRLVPSGIDAWWQDATEPENDDLVGRRVNSGLWPGEWVRNVFPLLVNKTVSEGLVQVQPDRRPMILTRSGFPGIQRYGSAIWSGDVGCDWDAFRRQITAGLGMQAAGIPWWTYDAGGFFRPQNQYQDSAYIQCMLRWIETSVYLPLMRVHGYMSNTEPWNYGTAAQQAIAQNLRDRYRLLPYIYSGTADVTFSNSTLMRPLVFDFADDTEALKQKYEYMFGRNLLVSPVTEPNKSQWNTYLPKHKAGWYHLRTEQHFAGGKTVCTDAHRIPVFVKGGSILPIGPDKQYTSQEVSQPIEVRVYPGADATFTLYEDDGTTNDYRRGKASRITFQWNDNTHTLTIGRREGEYANMETSRIFKVHIIGSTPHAKEVKYMGEEITIR